jgi:hypothetical protein
MKFHPALFMLMVWGGAFLAFFILPFELTYRSMSFEGMVVLLMFLTAFCIGAVMRTVYLPQHAVTSPQTLNTDKADMLLKVLAGIALLTMGLEVIRSGSLNLGAAYSQRSDQAQALLHGQLSNSSGIFKIGFICYPASYVFLARCIMFDRKPRFLTLLVFGILPGVMAGVAMGGRAPIFNTMAYGFLAYVARGRILNAVARGSDALPPRKIHPVIKIAAALGILIAFDYFIDVFVTRAELAGGTEAMLYVVASKWGVTFSGPGADLLIGTIGATATYLVFVFIWYLIQGIVMSNALFTTYDGEPLLGVYGVDILSAVMRRVDPVGVSDKFNYLLDLETYGFLPSAFGTLFVDYLYAGIILAGIWGWFAGVVYRNIRRGIDPRWFLFAPFITLGIVFSLVNTPLGFGNGFITHFWLIATFLLIRKPVVPSHERVSETLPVAVNK